MPLFISFPKQVEIDGVRVPVRDIPLSRKMKRRLMKGLYETAERKIIKRFIHPGDKILEVGASIGIVTCFLSQAANGARIVSIEPDARLKVHFDRQIELNGATVELINAACCPIWRQSVPESVSSQAFLPSHDPLTGRAMGSTPGTVPVRWITAEQACADTGLEPTALVVDVEGAEAIWAELPPSFPESIRMILVEIHPEIINIEVAGKVVQAVLDEGFRVSGVRGNVFAFERRH